MEVDVYLDGSSVSTAVDPSQHETAGNRVTDLMELQHRDVLLQADHFKMIKSILQRRPLIEIRGCLTT